MKYQLTDDELYQMAVSEEEWQATIEKRLNKRRNRRLPRVIFHWRPDQAEKLDEIEAFLVRRGVEVDRSKLIRLALDLGFDILERFTIPDVVTELEIQKQRAYYSTRPNLWPTPEND